MAWEDIQYGERDRTARDKLNALGQASISLASVIPVNTASEFPTQDATTITFGSGSEANKVYVVGSDVTTTKDVIVAGPCTLVAASVNTVFTFNTLSANDCTFFVRNITLNSPNRDCLICNSTGTFDLSHRINVNTVFILDCARPYVSNGGGIIAETLEVRNASVNGITFAQGDVGICSLNRVGMFGLPAGASTVDMDPLNTIFTIYEMSDVAGFGDPAAHYIRGGVDSINILPGFSATVTGGNAGTFPTPLVGVTTSDGAWIFRGNSSNIPDSVICGATYLGSVTDVDVTAADTFYKINAGNWVPSMGCRLTVTTDGDFINETFSDILVKLDGSVTVEKLGGGGSEYITARIVFDDLPNDPQSIATTSGTQNGDPTAIPLTGLFTLPPQKGVSICVSIDATFDIRVSNANFATLQPV